MVLFSHMTMLISHIGIDDLRAIVYRRRAKLLTYMADFTYEALFERFGYIFETPEGSGYPPILEAVVLDPELPHFRLRVPADALKGACSPSIMAIRHAAACASGHWPIRRT